MATAPQHLTSLASLNRDVANWVDEVARLTKPDRIYWCDGSESEFQMLQRELVAKKELLPLNACPTPANLWKNPQIQCFLTSPLWTPPNPICILVIC